MTNGRAGRRSYWDVVLAEDNDDHTLLIKMALERASRVPVEVRRARNGDEAIEPVQSLPPDLLLLDLKMPGRSGHEVLERIKGDDQLRKVPVPTSSDRDEDVARSYGLGSNHFITKPENPVELEARLRSLLNNTFRAPRDPSRSGSPRADRGGGDEAGRPGRAQSGRLGDGRGHPGGARPVRAPHRRDPLTGGVLPRQARRRAGP